MLEYPSITKNIIDVPIYAYDKLDGSNIRVEWSRKNNFTKFGSRKRLLSADENPLGESIHIFNETLSDRLVEPLRKLRVERATLFMEFSGENSFAGFHEDEKHSLTLFDVSLYKKGFMLPKEFMKTFGDVVPTADLLYYGKPNSDFIEEVHNGSLDGMTFEGVVCKSQELVRNKQIRFKVKNDAWLNKLKNKCDGDEKMFEQLS